MFTAKRHPVGRQITLRSKLHLQGYSATKLGKIQVLIPKSHWIYVLSALTSGNCFQNFLHKFFHMQIFITGIEWRYVIVTEPHLQEMVKIRFDFSNLKIVWPRQGNNLVSKGFMFLSSFCFGKSWLHVFGSINGLVLWLLVSVSTSERRETLQIYVKHFKMWCYLKHFKI